jgi:exodeoxyribonuclease VIII
MDVTIDLETLDFRSTSVVLTLGAIKFDPYSSREPGPGYYVRFNVDQQLALGRTVDDATLQWWRQQPDHIRDEAMQEQDRTDINQALDELCKFLVGVDNIWAQGPVFDIAMLENLLSQLKRPYPWQYYQIRDSRTLFGLGWDPRREMRTEAHNALADCYYQSIAVQKVYAKFNVTKS